MWHTKLPAWFLIVVTTNRMLRNLDFLRGSEDDGMSDEKLPEFRELQSSPHLWWMKELMQVKRSSGTMAHRVIMLLNFDSRTLRVSTSINVPLWVLFRASASGAGSLRRLVKYCEEIIRQSSDFWISATRLQFTILRRKLQIDYE